jgi:hypothetical protein
MILLGRAAILEAMAVTSTFDDLGSEYLGGPMMDLHGETVIFRPKGAAARTITAVVNRDLAAPLEGFPSGVPTPVAQLEVRLDETAGITLDELNRGEDQIDVADKPGGTRTRRRITNFSDAVGGFVTLDVR